MSSCACVRAYVLVCVRACVLARARACVSVCLCEWHSTKSTGERERERRERGREGGREREREREKERERGGEREKVCVCVCAELLQVKLHVCKNTQARTSRHSRVVVHTRPGMRLSYRPSSCSCFTSIFFSCIIVKVPLCGQGRKTMGR